MPMTLVSNHGITEDEFNSWRTQCDKDNRPQITVSEVDEVKARLHKAHTYVLAPSSVISLAAFILCGEPVSLRSILGISLQAGVSYTSASARLGQVALKRLRCCSVCKPN